MQLAILHRGEMIVDNFFVISGLLVAYVHLQVIPKKGLDLLRSSVSKIARLVLMNCYLYCSRYAVTLGRCIRSQCICAFVCV